MLCSTAPAAVLDFEDFHNGQIIDAEYQPLVTVTAINNNNGAGIPDFAVVLDSRLRNGRDPDLQAPFRSRNPALPGLFTPGNILILQENGYGCGDGICDHPDDEGTRFQHQPTGIISFQFNRAIELISLDFFDVEVAEDGNSDNNRIRLFDHHNSELFADTYYTPNTGGNNLWDQILFGGPDSGLSGINRIDVYLAGSGALDNLVFNEIHNLPIPAAGWLFGSTLIGFIAYSRRRRI